jgi:hypothetical protein
MYGALLATRKLDEPDRSEASKMGLEAAQAIGSESSRAEALAALAPQLEGEPKAIALAQALQAAQAIGNEYARADVLAALVPQLEGALLVQALQATQAIRDESSRARALAALVPQLEGALLAQALQAAQAIRNEYARATALAAFLSIIPDTSSLVRDIQSVMANYILDAGDKPRAEVLRFSADNTLFASPILSSGLLRAIAAQIIEICGEWKWL